VLLQNVTGFELEQRQVLLESGPLNYDYLVLALGRVTSYFGHPEWEPHAPGLKSLDDALCIRRQILLAFERAENSLGETEKTRLMSIVVIGGGYLVVANGQRIITGLDDSPGRPINP